MSVDSFELPGDSPDSEKAKAKTEKKVAFRLTKKKIESVYRAKTYLESKYNTEQGLFDAFEQCYEDTGFGERSVLSYDDEGNELDLVVNIVQTVIEQKRAMIGIVPNVHCQPKSYSDEDIKAAQTREKAILSIWDDCNIGQIMGDMGYHLGIYGTAVGVVYADSERHRPKMSIRSPKGFYCLPKEEDGVKLAMAMFVSTYWGGTADALYPGHHFSSDEEVEIVEYWDSDCHLILARDGDERILAHENKLGVVPVVVFPNISKPKSPYGYSDVGRIIGLQREVNRRMSLEADIIEKVLDAPYVVINPDESAEELAIEPGGVIPVGEGGDVRQLNAFNLPYSWETSFGRLMNLFDRQADAPEVLRGTLDSAIVSGKGVDSLLGPVSGRIELRHHYIFPRLAWMNSMALMMWEKFWPNEPHILDGTQMSIIKPQPFIESFESSELGGDYRNRVFMNSYAYLDQNAQIVLGLQLVQNQIISKMTLRNELSIVQDSENEDKQIQKEAISAVQLAAAAQMVAQGPSTMNPNLQEPGMTNYRLQKGYAGELPPAQVPGGMELPAGGGMPAGMPMEAPAPGEMEGEDLMEGLAGAEGAGGNQLLTSLADFFRSVQRIKGRVFLVGAIVEGVAEDLDYTGLEVAITNPQDKQTILNAIKNEIPELHGNVQFQTVSGQPTGAFLEVTPGTQGYEVQGMEAAPLQGAGAEGMGLGALPPMTGQEMMMGPQGGPGNAV